MASVSDTRYKQQAVIEFLVAEKKSVGKNHKRLCAVYGSCAVETCTVGSCVQRAKVSGSGEWELHGRPRSGRLPQPPSETCYMALISLFVRIGTPQVGNWQYRFPSAMEVQLIQHGNVRPHTSLRTQEAIAKYSWTLLCHPPRVLIWRRQIFAFFGSLKNAMNGTRFEDDESVIRALRTRLREQDTSWY
jgi:hypothetical protein